MRDVYAYYGVGGNIHCCKGSMYPRLARLRSREAVLHSDQIRVTSLSFMRTSGARGDGAPDGLTLVPRRSSLSPRHAVCNRA